jgi:hypothetical protein
MRPFDAALMAQTSMAASAIYSVRPEINFVSAKRAVRGYWHRAACRQTRVGALSPAE